MSTKAGTPNTVPSERVSRQGTLTREHVSTQDMSVREHVSTQSSLAREQIFGKQGTQISRLLTLVTYFLVNYIFHFKIFLSNRSSFHKHEEEKFVSARMKNHCEITSKVAF